MRESPASFAGNADLRVNRRACWALAGSSWARGLMTVGSILATLLVVAWAECAEFAGSCCCRDWRYYGGSATKLPLP